MRRFVYEKDDEVSSYIRLPQGSIQVFSGHVAFLHLAIQRCIEQDLFNLFWRNMMLPDKLVKNVR